VFSLEDALKLVATRGQLMDDLPRDGRMLAVFADEPSVVAALESFNRDVWLAAVNGPEQVVVAGRSDAVDALAADFRAQGIKTRLLPVSRAFHSPLVEPVMADFERACRKVAYSAPLTDVICNVTGQVATAEIATPEYWCRHLRRPVRFADGMATLAQRGANMFVEIGPEATLLALGRGCLAGKGEGRLWLPSLRKKRGDWMQLLESLGRLYVRGVPIDWQAFDGDYPRRKLALPNYPFQRERYWVERPAPASGPRPLAFVSQRSGHPLRGCRLELAGKETVFQSRFDDSSPAYLKDHRVFASAVMPTSGYLEIALSAGAEALKRDDLAVQDLCIHGALKLSDDRGRTVQVVLAPTKPGGYEFRIASLDDGRDEEQQSWTLHASGRIVIRDQPAPPPTEDLAALRSRCSAAISVEDFYDRCRQRGVDYGPQFRALQQLSYSESQALGMIQLPESLAGQLGDYQLHPVLLDGCFQVLAAALPESVRDRTWLPTSIERFRVFQPAGSAVWSCVRVRPAQSPDRQTLSVDVHILSPSGQLIAAADGLCLQRVDEDILRRRRSAAAVVVSPLARKVAILRKRRGNACNQAAKSTRMTAVSAGPACLSSISSSSQASSSEL
jgi:acyl transferase domain-containing protein